MCMCLGVWLLVCLIIFLVEAEVVVAKKWRNRVVGCRREVVKVEELKKNREKTGVPGQVEGGMIE